MTQVTVSVGSSVRAPLQGNGGKISMIRVFMAAGILFALEATAIADNLRFDADAIGSSPTGWTIAMTGQGNSKWTVEKDDSAPSKPTVLKQSGEATYPLALEMKFNRPGGDP